MVTPELCTWFKIQIGPNTDWSKLVIFSANPTENQYHHCIGFVIDFPCFSSVKGA